MKTLTKLALAAVLLTTSAAAHAETVRGHFRSNGTYVAPYYRTQANGTPYDNLSYRGYPSQQPGYISPRKSGWDSSFTMPRHDFNMPSQLPACDVFDSGVQTMPDMGPTYKGRSLSF